MKRDTKTGFLHSSFFKDGLSLISGNVWAQAITFAAYLLLSRLFSPEDFGLYNIFYSYIDVLVIVSTCKYEMAVVLADSDREAMAVSRLALRLNTIISLVLLSMLAIVIVGGRIGLVGGGLASLSVWPLSFIALLIPPMVFFCGTTRVYAALFNRMRRFGHIALSEVVGATSGVVFKILFGLPRLASSALHVVGLPLGTVLGKVAGNVNYLLKLRKLDLPRDISSSERKAMSRRFRNFPLFMMPKDLINSLSYNLPFLWLAIYFDKAEVGLFSLALTFTFRPINIFNTAFEKLLYVRVAEKVRAHKTIKSDIMSFVKYVNIVSLPFFIVLFLFADAIFGFLFGGQWDGCGYYIRCLLPWVYVMLTSSSLMFISNIFSKQRTEFMFYIVLFALRVAAIVVGITCYDFRLAILLFSLSGMAISLLLIVWYMSLVGKYERQGE